MELANNLGAKGILLNDENLRTKLREKNLENTCVLITKHWKEVYQFLTTKKRIGKITRMTKETSIQAEVNLDGTGETSIHTGIGFFDHMLEQIAKHGSLSLVIQTKGDLHIDEHHTIEDTGLALGEAFLLALGDKRGIERYGFCLPMDDCLAQVALDFGGRPWIVWDAEFKREKIGEMPTEMFFHFFKSFSDAAKCNLNIKAEGTNEHHKIEAIFKAFARAIKMAAVKSGSALPSTKGVL
jgi:imidazoleglycerol-phosphate dehydratase/histidinol-phosphatase